MSDFCDSDGPHRRCHCMDLRSQVASLNGLVAALENTKNVSTKLASRVMVDAIDWRARAERAEAVVEAAREASAIWSEEEICGQNGEVYKLRKALAELDGKPMRTSP